MNAVAANSSASQIGNGILAAMAVPVASPAANVSPTPTFMNMVSLLLSPSLQQRSLIATTISAQDSSTTSTATFNTGSPAQIADAMIRSMLGRTSSANVNGPAPNVTANPPVLGTVQNLTARKQGRGMADLLPQMTAMPNVPLAQVLPSPAPAAPASQTSQAPADPNAIPTSSLSGWTAARVQTSTSIMTPAVNVAFTAVLTPMKGIAPVDLKASALPQSAVSQPAATATASASPLSEPVASTNQSAKTDVGNQILNSQNTQTASANGQSSGDAAAQQQQHDDSPANAKPTMIPSDAKAKAQIVKPADTSAQVPAAQATVTDRPVAPTPLASTAPADSISPRAETSSSPASATEAMRNSEPSAPVPEPLRAGAVQEITIRIAPPNASPVDLRVIERSGQVHVDVRTADAGMQTALRQDLGTLTTSLQKAGYHAETFTPSMVAGRAAASAQNNQDGQQDSSKQRNGSGESPADRRQQQRQKQTGNWLEEQENQ